MRRNFIPTTSADDWRKLLADPEKHWRKGYSAKSLAYCWEDADGFPSEIDRLFSEATFPPFEQVELLLAFPEYKVSLPGGSRPSQNDIFVLAKTHDGQLIAITIEGKVAESFGPTLEEWSSVKSTGREQRLEFLKEQLGLTQELPPYVRYQLLHRTASAIIEARRFNAQNAAMIVHSFSPKDQWFEDYEAFLELFSARAVPNELVFIKTIQGITLYSGWAKGYAKYLEI